MSQRRMFSPDIVCSDAFLDMSVSARDLYYQLAMAADDDGFVNPRRVMRNIGSSDDDLKVLLAKRFLIVFQDGVVVIKHWLIHNLIRQDRYKPTLYTEHMKGLKVKENKAYTELATNGLQNGNQMAPQVRLGKVRIEGDFSEKITSPSEITRVNTTTEGEEVKPKEKYAHRGTPAWELRIKLYKMLGDELDEKVVESGADLVRLNAALKAGLKEEDIIDIFESALAYKTIYTVRSVFSDGKIQEYLNEYK